MQNFTEIRQSAAQ